MAEGEWLHMDYRAEIWWGSTFCVWVAPFREALLTVELGKGLEKVAQTKPSHTKLASLLGLVGCPSLAVRTKSKIWPSSHGIFEQILDKEISYCPERCTALVAHVLKYYSMHIAALQESRFAGECVLQEEEGGYTFFWSGRPEGEWRESGVCMAIKNCLAAKLLTLPVAINDQIQTL